MLASLYRALSCRLYHVIFIVLRRIRIPTNSKSNTLADTRSYTSVHPTQSPNYSLSCECLKHQPCFHIFHPSPRWGSQLPMSRQSAFPSLCYEEGRHHPKSQLAHLIPLSGNIKQMSASKRNQSINHSSCVELGASEEDIREEGPSQEPPILQGAVFPQDMSIHLSSQKGLSSLC